MLAGFGDGLITTLPVVCCESMLLVRRLVRRTGLAMKDSLLFLRDDTREDAPRSEFISSIVWFICMACPGGAEGMDGAETLDWVNGADCPDGTECTDWVDGTAWGAEKDGADGGRDLWGDAISGSRGYAPSFPASGTAGGLRAGCNTSEVGGRPMEGEACGGGCCCSEFEWDRCCTTEPEECVSANSLGDGMELDGCCVPCSEKFE